MWCFIVEKKDNYGSWLAIIFILGFSGMFMFDLYNSLIFKIIFEVCITLFVSYFAILPYVKEAYNDEYKKFFVMLFVVRIPFILLFFKYAFIFLYVFDIIYTIILRSKYSSCKRSKILLEKIENSQGVVQSVTQNVSTSVESSSVSEGNFVNPADFGTMYTSSEAELLYNAIHTELAKISYVADDNKIPYEVKKRKSILKIIFTFLLFVYISLIFFHFPSYTYVIGGVVLLIFIVVLSLYNFDSYLMKKVKERPDEKISNIVFSEVQNMVDRGNKLVFTMMIIMAIGLPLFIFYKPHYLYEKVENGYALRYYTFGISNYKSVEIPEQYKNVDIVSLRGNAFSNMSYLESVTLPDTITEIRGQAFKNDTSLKSVKLPSKLEYLGGGAFYNCTALRKVELPRTLTYLGGEAFYNATSLSEINIPSGITEIRGSTFENCSSLEEISIPDAVIRIGGHAFYGCSSLSNVYINPTSSLNEIGSSAFRKCSSLKQITLPPNVSVNERAFKESPTEVYEYVINGNSFNRNTDSISV